MVVTDCVGPMWYQAPIWDAIGGWGLFSPVVVVTMLPSRLWPRTALGSPEVTMRSHQPGAANRSLDVSLPWWWPEDGLPPSAMPVPVITLEADRVAAWASMVMGAGGVEVPGVFAAPPPDTTSARPADSPPLDAEERVRQFQVTVSRVAYRLAVFLSAALRGPWGLALARVVQEALLPDSGQVHLAEVVVGGLVRRVEPQAGNAEPMYEFADGVVNVLQRSLTGTEALRVLQVLGGYIESETGRSPGIAALLLDEAPPAEVSESFEALQAGATSLIQRMGLARATIAPGPATGGAGTDIAAEEAAPYAEAMAPRAAEPQTTSEEQTVLSSIETVTSRDSSGVLGAVLDLVAVLSGPSVDRTLLYGAGPTLGLLASAVKPVIDSALAQLADASLLTLSADGSAVASNQLVMRIVREQRAREGTLAAAGLSAVRLLQEMSGSLVPVSRHRGAVNNLIEQIDTVNENLAPFLTSADATGLMPALLSLRGLVLQWLIDPVYSPDQAIAYGQLLVRDCEQVLGADHPDTLTSRDHLGYGYLQAGRARESIPLFEETLAARLQALGAEHPDTLTSRDHLAFGYLQAGRVSEAIPLFEQTLAFRLQMLGAEHPDTLTSRDHLGYAYLQAGRVAEAIPQLEQTVDARVRVLGADHPDTLTSMDHLASALVNAGRLEQAIPLYERALADSERVLGSDHPTTLSIRRNLSAVQGTAHATDGVIFLSYRRDQSSFVARSVRAALAARFGPASVFMDETAVSPDQDWPREIQEAILRASVMLVLIGPYWLGARDPSGSRPLDDPGDWIRREVEAGLARPGLAVVPVLVDGARMPPGSALPASLSSLADRQAFVLTGVDFDQEIDALAERVGALRSLPGPSSPRPEPSGAAIFLSYRRDQSSFVARSMRAVLANRLGTASVFMDETALSPDQDWPREVQDAILRASVMLVIIGPYWLEARDPAGSRRLDDPGDWIRREVEAGLARPGLAVVPVLVDGATMPPGSALPASLRPLADRQAFVLAGVDLDQEIGALLGSIGKGQNS
jgi:tetratricopeptide (TPR) repeat protein